MVKNGQARACGTASAKVPAGLSKPRNQESEQETAERAEREMAEKALVVPRLSAKLMQKIRSS